MSASSTENKIQVFSGPTRVVRINPRYVCCILLHFVSFNLAQSFRISIRQKSLISLDGLNFKDAHEILTASKSSDDLLEEAERFLTAIDIDFRVDFDVENEEGILFYIAGYCARGVIKSLKCDSCSCLFMKSRDAPEIQFDDDLGDKKEEYLEMINRGGLFTPSDSLYICVLYARKLFQKIHDKGDNEKRFLAMGNQRDIFSACLQIKMEWDDNSAAILEQKCQLSHTFSDQIKRIGDKIFNTFSKNFIGELNDKIHKDKKRKDRENPKQSSSARKIKKLQSE